MVLQGRENTNYWAVFLTKMHDEVSEALAFLFDILDFPATFLFEERVLRLKELKTMAPELRMTMLSGWREGL